MEIAVVSFSGAEESRETDGGQTMTDETVDKQLDEILNSLTDEQLAELDSAINGPDAGEVQRVVNLKADNLEGETGDQTHARYALMPKMTAAISVMKLNGGQFAGLSVDCNQFVDIVRISRLGTGNKQLRDGWAIPSG